MNKQDLASAVAESVDKKITKADAKEVVDGIVDAITESLKKGEKVQIVGFGTWDVKTRNARKGRNPKTGEEIDIPEKKVVKFKPSKALNESLNS
jgi:DNA-binding protein HU-beta